MNAMQSDWIEAIVRPIGHATWQGGGLALIVLVVTHAVGDRLRANWRFGLWLVVFARLATPWIPATPWSVYSLIPDFENQRVASDPARSIPAVDGAALENGRVPFAESEFREIRNRRPRAAGTARRDVITGSSERHTALDRGNGLARVSLAQWLALAWLAGVLVLAARMLSLHVRLARARALWPVAADPALSALFEECRREAGVRSPVTLHLAPRDVGPATCGVQRPAIILTARLAGSLAPQELRMVLMHELIHVRRRDALVDLAAACIACLHWFNPAAWLALARLRNERELACDAALLNLLGTDARRHYGSLLLKVVESMQPAAAAAGAVAMFEGRFFAGSLERRIQMIANYRRMTTTAKAAGFALLISLALIGLTDAAAPPARQAAGDSAGAGADADPTGAAKPDANEPAGDEFPLPVPTERAVAQQVRDLGGWYELDGERHVVEVNMVYHYDASGERHENDQKTDEILVHIDELPRLKRLLLTETQASDKGLEIVGRLRELEELFIWDAANVTDKGAAVLGKLPKLKFLLLNGTAMTDEGVAHLAEIASLETLYIGNSTFTDKALEYASRLPRLKALDICNYTREFNTAITAAGMKFVREMSLLEELGVPFTESSDEALKELHGLKMLRRLDLDDTGDVFNINARVKAAVSALQKANPNLEIIVSGNEIPSPNAIAAAADPKQQEINRREGAEGLKTIERFLELMWARRDAEAAALGDSEVVANCRRMRREPGFRPLRISAAYGDNERVRVVTTPPVTYTIYEMVGQEKRAIEKKTAHVVLTAIRKKDGWYVQDSHYEDVASDDSFKRFLAARPGAQKLNISSPGK